MWLVCEQDRVEEFVLGVYTQGVARDRMGVQEGLLLDLGFDGACQSPTGPTWDGLKCN